MTRPPWHWPLVLAPFVPMVVVFTLDPDADRALIWLSALITGWFMHATHRELDRNAAFKAAMQQHREAASRHLRHELRKQDSA